MAKPEKVTRVGVVSFGGSISTVQEDSGVKPLQSKEKLTELLRSFDKEYGKPVAEDLGIEIANFYDINRGDTLERTPAQFEELCLTVNQAQMENDALLILDGPDAVAYDGAAVTYALHNNQKVPYMFVVDHTSLGDGFHNAESEIRSGLQILHKADLNGILETMVTDGSGNPLRASRAVRKDDYGYPILEAPLDGEGELEYIIESPDPAQYQASPRSGEISTKFDFDRIGFVNQVPGYNPRRLIEELRAGCYSALIITSLETGRIPQALRAAVTDDYIRRVPVLIQTEHIQDFSRELREDISTFDEIQKGAISILDMTHSAALMKTAWLLGQGIHDVDEFRKGFYADYGDITV